MNRFNQRNLRSGGESAYNPEAAYNPKSFDERVAETREQNSRKSTADEISDDLSRVEKALDDLEAAVVDGDDEARKRVAKGIFAGTDDDVDTVDAVEKAARATEAGDLPNLPDEDYSGTAADAVDDEPARLRKSDSTVGDVKGVGDAPDRHSESNTRTDDDPTTGNPRMVDPDK